MDNEKKTWSILLYKSPNGESTIDVRFEWETVWLSEDQMANLFGKGKTTINEHILNIYKEGELERDWTMTKYRKTGNSGLSTKPTNYYNLDVIISVWYRVKSLNGTKFRIRATKQLKEYLIQWYSINQKRLSETWLRSFEKAISLVKRNIENNRLTDQETKWMLSVITNYTYSWIILQRYDEGTLVLKHNIIKKIKKLEYNEVIEAIKEMRNELLPKKEVSDSFGVEKNDGLRWILRQIYQTFDWVDLYPSIEEKAAALLYFTIKNHPFVDGNKKIWAFLFVLFLAKNKYLYRKDWSKRIEDTTLIALTLLIATSESGEKEMILKLVASFLLERSY